MLSDLRARLAVLGVPILLPEEFETPSEHTSAVDAKGRPLVTAPRGLGAFLTAHPSGYVQLLDPQPLTLDPPVTSYLITVDCVGATETVARALYEAVIEAVASTTRSPSSYLPLAPSGRALNPGRAYAYRLTFET